MGYGVSKNRIHIIIVFILLLILSIDTINRYFRLLEGNDLVNSQIYTVIIVFLFFYINAILFFAKSENKIEDHLFKLFSLTSSFSVIFLSESIGEMLKGLVFTNTFIAFYYYGKYIGRNPTVTNFFMKLGVSLILFVIVYYLFTFLINNNVFAIISNDAIFSVICFSPFIFLTSNNKLRISLAILIVICCFLSQKRTAIVFVNSFTIISLFFLFKKSKLKLFLFILVFVTFFVYYFDDIVNSGYVLSALNRFETSGSNGRDEIFVEIFHQFENSNIISIMFGNGYLATIKSVGVPAHNDFIEIFYNNGLISFFIYCLILLFLLRDLILLIRIRGLSDRFVVAYGYIFCLLITLSYFNFMIYSLTNMVFFMIVGYIKSFTSNK